VVERLAEHPLVGEPLRCGVVQACQPAGMVAFEAAAQEIGEQMVVPEPAPLIIERPQEQVS
jgi:hypothetical protein